jgi:hypothetical protein
MIVLLIFLGFLAFAFLSMMMQGGVATAGIISSLVIFLLVAALILGAGYAVYYVWFMKKPPIFSRMVKKNIIDAALLTKSPYVRDLYLRSDPKHQGVCLGTILGHMQQPRNVVLGRDWLEFDEERQKALLKKKGSKQLEIIETAFVVKMKGWIRFFVAPLVVIAIENAWEIKERKAKGKVIKQRAHLKEMTQHSDLLGDVYLSGVSLQKVGEYYYLPSYGSSPVVDQIQSMDIMRMLTYYAWNEIGVIASKAMDANIPHLMRQDEQKIIDMSRPAGEVRGGGVA